MTKTKTLRHIWAQSERIIDYLKAQRRYASVSKIERIGCHYGANMCDWMRTKMDEYDMDEYAEVTPVPMNVYTRPMPRPFLTFNVRVIFDDGDELTTRFVAHDEDEVREHYIGKKFAQGYDDGSGWKEYMRTANAVEFL